jgi:hypothetical protein
MVYKRVISLFSAARKLGVHSLRLAYDAEKVNKNYTKFLINSEIYFSLFL